MKQTGLWRTKMAVIWRIIKAKELHMIMSDQPITVFSSPHQKGTISSNGSDHVSIIGICAAVGMISDYPIKIVPTPLVTEWCGSGIVPADTVKPISIKIGGNND